MNQLLHKKTKPIEVVAMILITIIICLLSIAIISVYEKVMLNEKENEIIELNSMEWPTIIIEK